MNIFGALIPCALQRTCWSGDERMTERMGAATSTPPGDTPPPPIMPSSTSDQLSVVVRSVNQHFINSTVQYNSSSFLYTNS